ncbi:MAG: hypothetical protein QNJ13_10720 [Paracoccaceae bacterium]|nr:hypothetical protein [Paracoccaceae bacterium]
MNPDSTALIDAFEDLLDQERALLLSGSLDGLGRIAELKTGLAAHLRNAAGNQDLGRLKRKAQRNTRLLEAAGAGIRSVLRRVDALRNGPAPLSTYAADGQRTTLGGTSASLERRA